MMGQELPSEPRASHSHAADREFEGSSAGRTAVWTTIGRVAGLSAFALSTALLAGLLPSDAIGSFFVVQALVAFASPVAAAGNARSATLAFSGRPQHEFASVNRAWSTHRNRQVLCGSFVAALIVTFVLIVPLQSLSLEAPMVVVAGACAVGLGWQLVLAEALRAGGNVRDANLGTGRSGGVITQCSFVLLLVGAWVIRADIALRTTLCLYLLSILVGFLHLLVAYLALVRTSTVATGANTLLNIRADSDGGGVLAPPVLEQGTLSSSVKTVQAEVLVAGLNQLDLLLVGAALAGGPLATYAVARRLSTVLATPQLIGSLSVMPAVAVALKDGTTANLSRRLGRVSLLALAVTIAGGIGLGLPLRWLAGLLDVPDAADLQVAFLIMAVGQVANAATGPSGSVLMLAGKQSDLTRHSIANLAFVGAAFAVVAFFDGGAVLFGTALTVSMVIRFVSLRSVTLRLTGVSTGASMLRISRTGESGTSQSTRDGRSELGD